MVLVASSCITQKKCLIRFPVLADTVKVVSYRDSIVYRDTIIQVFLPGDTVIRTDSVVIPCPPPPPEFVPDTARAQTHLSEAKAWFDYPYIRLQVIEKDTTIFQRLDSAIREAYYWRDSYEQITAVVEKKKIPVIYKVALGAWIGVLIFIVFVMVINSIIKK